MWEQQRQPRKARLAQGPWHKDHGMGLPAGHPPRAACLPGHAEKLSFVFLPQCRAAAVPEISGRGKNTADFCSSAWCTSTPTPMFLSRQEPNCTALCNQLNKASLGGRW